MGGMPCSAERSMCALRGRRHGQMRERRMLRIDQRGEKLADNRRAPTRGGELTQPGGASRKHDARSGKRMRGIDA